MSASIVSLEFDYTSNEDDELYTALSNVITVEAFIDTLRNATCDFHKMVRPYCVVFCEDAIINDYDSNHYHAWTYEEALQVAQIIKNRLGVVAISRMDTYYAGHLMTLMDALDMEYGTHDTNPLFLKAFEDLGFKRAKECNAKSLYGLYMNTSARYEVLEARRAIFEIELLLATDPYRKAINEEIVMEIFKPERILNWIENEYELEDYMC